MSSAVSVPSFLFRVILYVPNLYNIDLDKCSSSVEGQNQRFKKGCDMGTFDVK